MRITIKSLTKVENSGASPVSYILIFLSLSTSSISMKHQNRHKDTNTCMVCVCALVYLLQNSITGIRSKHQKLHIQVHAYEIRM